MIWLWLFIIFDVIILFVAYSFVVSLKFYNTIYHTVYRKKYQPNYSPSMTIFIPCKGISEHSGFFE
jgi:alpha-N-acetylglucosamine transferase